jgi:hypothetical protein
VPETPRLSSSLNVASWASQYLNPMSFSSAVPIHSAAFPTATSFLASPSPCTNCRFEQPVGGAFRDQVAACRAAFRAQIDESNVEQVCEKSRQESDLTNRRTRTSHGVRVRRLLSCWISQCTDQGRYTTFQSRTSPLAPPVASSPPSGDSANAPLPPGGLDTNRGS